MIAYNHKSLDNLLIADEASAAFKNNLILGEEHKAIRKAYPVNFWTPNPFIRIGLFLLSIVITSMAFGFFTIASGGSTTLGILSVVFAVAAYVALEFFVREKQHCHSGVDDACIWLSSGFLMAGINIFFTHFSALGEFSMICILAAYYTLRFANNVMTGVFFISLLAVVFYVVIPYGNMAKAIMPFLLMAVSFAVYYAAQRFSGLSHLRHYQSCLLVIRVLSLLTLYGAVNFFVVREVSNEVFHLHLKPGESIPAGWVFWCMTAIIPLVYIYLGVRRRNAVLLRVGSLLIAVTVITIRYYHPVFPIEVSMTIGGVVLIGAAYGITRYLCIPRGGITHKVPNDPALPGALQLEALAIAQTFHHAPVTPVNNPVEFGGGSSGGAGATGQY